MRLAAVTPSARRNEAAVRSLPKSAGFGGLPIARPGCEQYTLRPALSTPPTRARCSVCSSSSSAVAQYQPDPKLGHHLPASAGLCQRPPFDRIPDSAIRGFLSAVGGG